MHKALEDKLNVGQFALVVIPPKYPSWKLSAMSHGDLAVYLERYPLAVGVESRGERWKWEKVATIVECKSLPLDVLAGNVDKQLQSLNVTNLEELADRSGRFFTLKADEDVGILYGRHSQHPLNTAAGIDDFILNVHGPMLCRSEAKREVSTHWALRVTWLCLRRRSSS